MVYCQHLPLIGKHFFRGLSREVLELGHCHWPSTHPNQEGLGSVWANKPRFLPRHHYIFSHQSWYQLCPRDPSVVGHLSTAAPACSAWWHLWVCLLLSQNEVTPTLCSFNLTSRCLSWLVHLSSGSHIVQPLIMSLSQGLSWGCNRLPKGTCCKSCSTKHIQRVRVGEWRIRCVGWCKWAIFTFLSACIFTFLNFLPPSLMFCYI